MLQCPNPNCQAENAERNRFCTQCRTPLPKRYLWGIGVGDRLKAGTLVGDRYRYVGHQVFLDLRPGQPPSDLTTLPPQGRPYLRLTQYRLHLPQLYDWIEDGPIAPSGPLLLLNDAAIYTPSIYTSAVGQGDAGTGGSNAGNSDAGSEPLETAQPQALPRLTDRWDKASPWRRLSWLWT